MNPVRPIRDSQSTPLEGEEVKSGGLKRQLLVSHLSVASMGLALLIVALGATFWLRSSALELSNVRAPNMERLLTVQGGIQKSLGALRGWVALGDGTMLSQWEDTWTKVIHPRMKDLQAQTLEEADSQIYQELDELLFELEETRSEEHTSELQSH